MFTMVESNGGVRFRVHVQPRSSRNEIAGVHGDALKVRLMAPPADGAANDALVALLADVFAVHSRSVRIVAGLHARAKMVELHGITIGDARGIAAAAIA